MALSLPFIVLLYFESNAILTLPASLSIRGTVTEFPACLYKLESEILGSFMLLKP
jgi:hypothetical protein